MNNLLRRLLPSALVLVAVWSAAGSMLMLESLDVDFTDAKASGEKAEWSERVDINAQGLGLDGAADTSRDGWIMTKPLAVGTAWRPASASKITVEVSPTPKPVQLNDGSSYTPDPGTMYARYSPDRKHWSTWQRLGNEAAKPEAGASKFQGIVQVPAKMRQRYAERLREYARQDVPWTSDEEAAVRWIVEREPNFFDTELPFVGYVQVLYEVSFHGGQRLRSLNVRTGEGIGGMHQSPKDPAEYKKHEGPWRYAAP